MNKHIEDENAKLVNILNIAQKEKDDLISLRNKLMSDNEDLLDDNRKMK